MPAGTPTRHVAFVQHKHDTSGSASTALAARCVMYAGTNFEGAAAGTDVVGTRLVRGPADPDGLGKAKWRTAYTTAGAAMDSHEHVSSAGTTRARRKTAVSLSGDAADTGGAEGWVNLTFRFSAVPPALAQAFYGFRCRPPGAATTDSRYDEANNFVTNGWGIKALVSATDITINLVKNGVNVASGILPLPTAGDVWQGEVRCTGKGTAADPSKYGVWVNGVKRLTYEDPADEFAAQTFFFVCDKEPAGTPASTEYDNVWFANTPNNPGAMPAADFYEANDFIPLSSEKAGDLMGVVLRWGTLLQPSAPLTEARVALTDLDGAVIWERAVTALETGILFLDGQDGAEALYLTHNGRSPTDPTTPGIPRSGAYLLRARIIRTDAVTPFDLTSEGTGTPNTGNTLNWTRGYGVGSTRALAVGVPTMPGWNDTARLSVTIDSQPYTASQGKVRFSTSQSQPAGRGGAAGEVIDALTTNWTLNADGTATLQSEPFTFDNRYAAAELAVSVGLVGRPIPELNNDPRMVFHAGPDATWLTQNPYESITKGAVFTTDPRIFIGTLLQINDPDWATPPMSKSVGDRRLTSQLGFLASRMSKRDGTGLNGLTVDRKLWDKRGLIGTEASPVKSATGSVTQTQGGEAGWQPGFLVWDNVLPTGEWTGKRTITAPAGAVGMEYPAYTSLFLSAVNPDYSVIVGAGHPAAVNQSEHWHPGDDLLIGVATYNLDSHQLVAVDTGVDAPTAVIGRFNTTFGVAQFLAADYTWQTLSGLAEAYAWPLSPSAGDPNVWVAVIGGATTASWSHSTLFFVANVHVNATPYGGTASLDAPGASSPHGRAFQVMTSGGPTSKPDHWSPGMTFQAGLAVIDMRTAKKVAIDGYKQVALFRLQDGGAGAGMAEYLGLDGVWRTLTDTATVDFHDVVESRPGSSVYLKNFTSTADWGTYDIFVMGRCKIGFFEFNNFAKEIGVGDKNKHSAYAFDGPGFLGFPTR